MKECQVDYFHGRHYDTYHNVFHENNLPDIPSLHDIGIIMSAMKIICQVDFFMAVIMIPISCNEGM
jgi:hypothetical protein